MHQMTADARMPTRRQLLGAGASAGAVLLASRATASAADTGVEPTLEPALKIIDPHHHLIDFGPHAPPMGAIPAHYLFDAFLADVQSGHDIRATVIVGGDGFARADGPEPMRVVGDTEFANGAAARSASGRYGSVRIGAGLVGQADLTLGSNVRDVLEGHLRAGGDRFRGIRHMTVWTDDPKLAPPGRMAPPDLAFHPDFQRGFAELAPLNLSFDAWCYFTQLDGIGELARKFPHTVIVMNHCGGPLGSASFASRRAEALEVWKKAIAALSHHPNVFMKLGGLGMWTSGLRSVGAHPPASSSQIAEEQRPYLETCIANFGADRCMFESNYPVEAGVGSYHTVWNAFKRVTQNFSQDEKHKLYFGTAARVYRLSAQF